MKPVDPTKVTTAECACGWSSRCKSPFEASERLRYHSIQVHNDAKATRRGSY